MFLTFLLLGQKSAVSATGNADSPISFVTTFFRLSIYFPFWIIYLVGIAHKELVALYKRITRSICYYGYYFVTKGVGRRG